MIFKLRNFESKNSGDATETSTWVDFISTYGYHPLYIYNKVYTPTKVHALCVYIPGVDSVDMYILELLWPWCVYIIAGVGRLYVAYPFSWGQCEGLKIKG